MIPTSTQCRIGLVGRIPKTADAIGVVVGEGSRAGGLGLPDAEQIILDQMIELGVFKGKPRESAGSVVAGRQILAAGLGTLKNASAQAYREAGAALARLARKRRVKHLVILVGGGGSASELAVEALATGALLASFDFRECKGKNGKTNGENGNYGLLEASICVGEMTGRQKEALKRAQVLAEAQNFARTIAYRPGNQVNPPELARICLSVSKQVGLKCRVIDEKQAGKLGMGGLLAVGAASKSPPRMICLEHKPAKSKGKPILLVGKSLTFDTGGISIKPADKMGRMIFDKCGGLAVLGAMIVAARMKLPLHVVGILPAAENHVSGAGYRPGDVIAMHNGVTVEVTNTDAEGRLVLADGLSWGIETFKPGAVIDIATLTGGVVVALGRVMAGVMSNDDRIMADLQNAADASGERIWPLPLAEDYKELLKSDPADIVNSGSREASPIQGGMFLSRFVSEETAWAHVDIAGVADTEKELPLYGKGPTGFGVRLLTEYLTRKARE